MKPITGYISAHRYFRSKITFAYERSLENTTYMLIENISQYFPNWLIDRLNLLTTISRPTKALEVKLLPYLKVDLITRVINNVGLMPMPYNVKGVTLLAPKHQKHASSFVTIQVSAYESMSRI